VIGPATKLDSRIVIYATEGFYSLRLRDGEGDGGEGTSREEKERRLKWLRYRNSATDLDLVKERLGVDVVFENVEKLSEEADHVREEEADAIADRWIEGAVEVEGDARKVLAATARWYVALKQDLEEKKAAGFTTICSQIEDRYGCNPCFAFMMLASEGYGFSCGIDVNALLTELMLSECEGGPMFQGNLMVENLPRGRVSIHHCMAPFVMDCEGEFNVRHIHSDEKRRGYVSAVRFKKGRVTLARLDSSLEFIHVSGGRLVDYTNHRDRCINEAMIEVCRPEDFEEHRIQPLPPSRIVHYVM